MNKKTKAFLVSTVMLAPMLTMTAQNTTTNILGNNIVYADPATPTDESKVEKIPETSGNLDKDSGYAVLPVFGKHQDKTVNDYFKITWTPSQVERIGIVIQNYNDTTKKYKITSNRAYTNKNGSLIYDSDKANGVGSNPDISSLVAFPKEVEVPAGMQNTIYVDVPMSKSDVEGDRLGSIYVTQLGDTEPENDNESTMKYNFAIPFYIVGNRPDNTPLKLEWGGASMKYTSNGVKIVQDIQNKTKRLIGDYVVDTSIVDSKGREVYGTNRNGIKFTPETDVPYEVMYQKDIPLKDGKYKIITTVSEDKTNGQELWKNETKVSYKKPVEKKAKPAKVEKKKAEPKQETKKGMPFAFKAIIGLVGVAIIAVAGLFMTKKKNND